MNFVPKHTHLYHLFINSKNVSSFAFSNTNIILSEVHRKMLPVMFITFLIYLIWQRQSHTIMYLLNLYRVILEHWKCLSLTKMKQINKFQQYRVLQHILIGLHSTLSNIISTKTPNALIHPYKGVMLYIYRKER